MIYLDFETRSIADLKRVGLDNYLSSPTTSITCLAYAIDDNPVQIWLPGNPFPELDFSGNLAAHNYRVERLILQQLLGIDTKVKQWLCTMALARSYCLPGKLESMGKFLRFPKLDQRSLHKLMRPRSTRDDSITWWEYDDCPEDYEKLYEYCKRDVEVSRRIHQIFGDMTHRERQIWGVTCKINERGFKIDRELIPKAQAELKREKIELNEELKAITGGIGVDQTVKLAKWAQMPSIDKEHLRDALASDSLEDDVRRALTIRKTLGQKSVSKLKTLSPLICQDDRLRDSISYAAAEKTKRWAGQKFQPQNMPRGDEEEFSQTIDNLINGIPLTHPHDEISNAIKRFIVGPFYTGDYSQIEARITAWIANETDLLETFRSGQDPYKKMAAETYNKPIPKVTDKERFMGKQQILSLGFGAGGVGFRNMLSKFHGVFISAAESQNYVDVYRNKYKNIVKLWHQTDRAFRRVIITRRPLSNKFLTIEPFGKLGIAIVLPGGSKIYYHRAKLVNGQIGFYGRIAGSNWGMIKTYGAKIIENVVQSTAREVIASAIIRLHKWPLVLLVHDEIVSEKYRTLEEFKELMESPPEWADGLPIAVDAKEVSRYHK